MEEFVRFGIDSGVQPATFVIHLDHRLVDRNVIRHRIVGRLYVGFLHPVVDGRSTPFAPTSQDTVWYSKVTAQPDAAEY